MDQTHLTELLELLEGIAEDRGRLTEIAPALRKRLLIAAGRVSRPDRDAKKRLNRVKLKKRQAERRKEDAALLDQAGIRRLRENPIFQTPRRQAIYGDLPPPIGKTHESRGCYVCHQPFHEVHFFYDQMCPECGDFNYRKRSQTADLTGRVAMITGARVKIGFQAAVLLLRAGAHVVVTTRFPRDAARRYAELDDFDQWSDRLQIHGIDLRRIGDIEALCAHLVETLPRLDFLINNACQTVRRPPGFYDHLMRAELTDLSGAAAQLVARGPETDPSAQWSQLPLLAGDADRSAFPVGQYDADEQQVDLRKVNSWRLRLDEVPTIELLEVQLVNAVAPFLLDSRLKPLMMRVPTADKHIVNVSAMEGQFYRTFKSDKHPHTNMAKAALNMLTRTSAADYVKDGIHMNAVDTGWVTDEDPVHHAARKREEHNFHPPLDIVDGAARIVDPILDGINTGDHVWGQFLKDYKPTDW